MPAIGDDLPVPDAVEDLLGTRVAGLPGEVRRLLLAVALSPNLRVGQLTALADPETLDLAVEAGVLVVDGEQVRASHPLLAAAATRQARAAERRELHRELAGVFSAGELRTRHLALAASEPDAALAVTVAAAATSAAARGAPQAAVELAEHALRLTPPPRSIQLKTLATSACSSWRATWKSRARSSVITKLLEPAVLSLPPGAARVRAYLLLTSGEIRGNDTIQAYLEQALAESGDDISARASVLAAMTENVAAVRVERIAETETWALEALPATPGAEPWLERHALFGLAWTRSLQGRPIDDLCERFRAASPAPSYIAGSPERVAGQRLVWRGELDEARAALTRLLAAADERGEPSSYALQRLHVCELELRAGRWDAAERLLDEWAESADRELLHWPMYERCRALHAAGRGLVDEARRWGEEAMARAEATGVRWDQLEALRALGHGRAPRARAGARGRAPACGLGAHRARGDPRSRRLPRRSRARRGARRARRPRTRRWRSPHRIEELARAAGPSLGACNRRGAARRSSSSAGRTTSGAVATARAGRRRARAARPRVRRGAVAPQRSAGRSAGPGSGARRERRWSEQRAAFDELGSPGWAEAARAELSRVGARRPQGAGELTPTERRVAELAATGLANKEIAQELVVTVNTVEFHLSNTYAKLGIRGRAQLAGRLEPDRVARAAVGCRKPHPGRGEPPWGRNASKTGGIRSFARRAAVVPSSHDRVPR